MTWPKTKNRPTRTHRPPSGDRQRTVYAGSAQSGRRQEITLSQFESVLAPVVPARAARLVVLVSGSGTLLQALLDAAKTDYPARVVAVGADRTDIEGLKRAEHAGLPSFAIRLRDYPDRAAWDAALTDAVAVHDPDFVVSAGFMKILGPAFLDRFPWVVNTHPALLPAFPGAHAVADALSYGVQVTGSTVHLVDGGVDTGPILAQEPVLIRPDEDEAGLHERIKTVERRLLVSVVARLAVVGCTVDGRKVSMP